MANDYQKINTLFLRDENNIIIPDRFTASEFTYLVNNLWECTEKIDGTNIHFDVDFIFRKADNGVVPESVYKRRETIKAFLNVFKK